MAHSSLIRAAESGQVAQLSVTHPILGTELTVGAHTIRIGPEQYLALVDELCNLAFLAPHLASRIHSLARDLKVPEVAQYVAWMREADTIAAEKTGDSKTVFTAARARPISKGKGKTSHDTSDTVDRTDRAGNAAGGNELEGRRLRTAPGDDPGAAPAA